MAEPVKGQVTAIQNYSKKKGIGKNGKEWNIMTVEIKTEHGKDVVADTFDNVELGSVMLVEFDSQYNTSKARLYRSNPQEERQLEMYRWIREIHAVVVGAPAPKPKTHDEQTVEDLENLGW